MTEIISSKNIQPKVEDTAGKKLTHVSTNKVNPKTAKDPEKLEKVDLSKMIASHDKSFRPGDPKFQERIAKLSKIPKSKFKPNTGTK